VREYCFTDVSHAFLASAKQHFGQDFPFLTYRLWNIEQPPALQQIETGGYDIAIATNVLHATRNLRNTLRNAKAALGGNGILVLNEISEKTVFASVLFGLIDGWSLAEDEAWRIPGSPGATPRSWRALLEREGFSPVLFPVAAAHDLGQQVIVAATNGLIRQPAGVSVSSAAAEAMPKVDLPQKQAGLEHMPDAAAAVEDIILSALAVTLDIQRETIVADRPFSDYGLDSILG